MALAWILGVPICLAGLVILLDRLEAWVVGPLDRADKVRRLLESTASDVEVERQVAALLAQVAPPAGVSPEPGRLHVAMER